MIIDCAAYRDGRRERTAPMTLNEAAAPRDPGSFVWLGTFNPTSDELDEIRTKFSLQDLAIEDAQEFHLRPKVEQFDDEVQLVILRTARYDGEREENRLRRDQHLPCAQLRDHGPAGCGQRTARRPQPVRTPARVVGQRQRVRPVGDPRPGRRRVCTGDRRSRTRYRTTRIDGVLRRCRTDGTDLLPAARSHQLLPSRLPAARCHATVERSAPEPLLPYLHDVHDVHALVNEEVAAQRDLLTTVLEANIAVISVEQTKFGVLQNTTIEDLTKLSTVFLPLTFVTGFFRQNFGALVDNIGSVETFVIFGIGTLLFSCLAFFGWFRITARKRAREIITSNAPLHEALPS